MQHETANDPIHNDQHGTESVVLLNQWIEYYKYPHKTEDNVSKSNQTKRSKHADQLVIWEKVERGMSPGADNVPCGLKQGREEITKTIATPR